MSTKQGRCYIPRCSTLTDRIGQDCVSLSLSVRTISSTILANKGAVDVCWYRRSNSNDWVSAALSDSAAGAVSAASRSVTRSVSTGRLPRNLSPSRRAISCPPPVEKTLLISPQHGQMYPLMFSIRPITGSETARVKERHFMASSSATAWGVVTMTADRREATGAICSISERCSSEVPNETPGQDRSVT